VRHLSTESRYQRFLVTVSELPDRKLHYFTEVDQVRHVALAAAVEREGRPAIVGVARYIVAPAGDSCEFAIRRRRCVARLGAGRHPDAGADRRGACTPPGEDGRHGAGGQCADAEVMRQLGFGRERNPDDRETVRVVRRRDDARRD